VRPNGLDGLELIPEPGEPRIVTAVDPSAVEHDVAWRSEVMGWAPLNIAPLPRRRRYVNRSGLSALVLVGRASLDHLPGHFLHAERVLAGVRTSLQLCRTPVRSPGVGTNTSHQ